LFFRKPHCPFCLHQKASNGEILYFHHVLEAKLVTPSGFAFSIATEPIENRDPEASKQDCELGAFYRLEKKLTRTIDLQSFTGSYSLAFQIRLDSP